MVLLLWNFTTYKAIANELWVNNTIRRDTVTYESKKDILNVAGMSFPFAPHQNAQDG